MAKLSLKDTEPATEEKSPMPVVKKNGTHHLVLNGKLFATVYLVLNDKWFVTVSVSGLPMYPVLNGKWFATVSGPQWYVVCCCIWSSVVMWFVAVFLEIRNSFF